MNTQKIEVDLPLSIYYQLKEIADASSWTFEEVVLQTIRSGLPPLLSKVPEAFHAELLALNSFNDMDLLKVVEGSLPSETPMDEEKRKADFEILRQTYALSLLKWRGHPIPAPFESFIG